MSFVIEPSIAKYHSNKSVDITQLPYKYLTYENETAAFFQTVAPWYQPGGKENQTIINNYGITTNQQYRKYMTSQSENIKQYNTNTFQSTVK